MEVQCKLKKGDLKRSEKRCAFVMNGHQGRTMLQATGNLSYCTLSVSVSPASAHMFRPRPGSFGLKADLGSF